MEKENIMGTKKMFPLLMSMAIPPMVSMLIQSMYNIVDSYFVAQMGKDALTAVSLAFPLQNITLALSVGLGVGLNSVISRSLGAKDKQGITNAATHGVALTALHSVLLLVVGLFLSRSFISMFSNDANVIQMGTEYCQVVLCLSFGMQFHITIEKMFQAVGNMFVPMCLQGVGAIVNIILDPILIFGKYGFPEMGVKGAAVATIIGQMTACLSAVLLFSRNKEIKVNFKKFKLDFSMIKKIYNVGVPSAVMTAMPSVLVSVLNGILVSISQSGVAVFGLYYKLQTFVYMPSSGLVQGLRPIIGYNYGAKKYDRLKQAMKSAMLVAVVIMVVGTVLFVAIPDKILLLFKADSEMLQMGVPALRIISIGFIFSAVSVVLSGAFEALGKGIQSLAVTLLRQLIIVVLLSVVLAKVMGLTGVWISFPVAEVIAAVLAIVLMKRQHFFGEKNK